MRHYRLSVVLPFSPRLPTAGPCRKRSRNWKTSFLNFCWGTNLPVLPAVAGTWTVQHDPIARFTLPLSCHLVCHHLPHHLFLPLSLHSQNSLHRLHMPSSSLYIACIASFTPLYTHLLLCCCLVTTLHLLCPHPFSNSSTFCSISYIFPISDSAEFSIVLCSLSALTYVPAAMQDLVKWP